MTATPAARRDTARRYYARLRTMNPDPVLLARIEAAEAEIDAAENDIVQRWHEGEWPDRTLPECLGMTEAQYSRWVQQPGGKRA